MDVVVGSTVVVVDVSVDVVVDVVVDVAVDESAAWRATIE